MKKYLLIGGSWIYMMSRFLPSEWHVELRFDKSVADLVNQDFGYHFLAHEEEYARVFLFMDHYTIFDQDRLVSLNDPVPVVITTLDMDMPCLPVRFTSDMLNEDGLNDVGRRYLAGVLVNAVAS